MAASMGKIFSLKELIVFQSKLAAKSGSIDTRVLLSACRNTSTNTDSKRTPPPNATPHEVREWKKLDWRAYATGKVRVNIEQDGKFPVLLIPGHSVLPQALDKREKPQRPHKVVNPPRYQQMLPDHDWTNVWPAAETFKWSVVPFPVRQGSVKNLENDGLPRAKYGNAELMKIPNFLHLTPGHIKKQCAALKKFCTPFPEALKDPEICNKHFKLHVYTSDYIADSPTVRDERARLVKIKFKLSDLELDEHARDKFLKLVGDRYDKKTHVVTLQADRCPMKNQNKDYIIYLLTALYHESWKTEEWETDETEKDMIKYDWPLTKARENLLQTACRMKQTDGMKRPALVTDLPDSPIADDLEKNEVVQEYKAALNSLFENGEDIEQTEKYKKATKKLLLGL